MPGVETVHYRSLPRKVFCCSPNLVRCRPGSFDNLDSFEERRDRILLWEVSTIPDILPLIPGAGNFSVEVPLLGLVGLGSDKAECISRSVYDGLLHLVHPFLSFLPSVSLSISFSACFLMAAA